MTRVERMCPTTAGKASWLRNAIRSPLGTESRTSATLNHRPDIDGLRAVAIIAVVAFHAFPTRLPGGFVGVDVFFVISGFLITAILLNDLRNGRFDLPRFYANRARRLLPALLAVLSTCWLAAWLTLLPDDFQLLGKHVTSSAAFLENVTLWQEDGYFDATSERKPLLHLWSLAIEEQFYLLYPLGLWLLSRAGWGLPFALGVVGLASFDLNVVGVRAAPVASFFLLPTRLWELLVGGIAAAAMFRVANGRKAGAWHPLRWPGAMREAAAGAGLLLIGGAAAGFDRSLPFPGAWALIPVTGALLLILAGADARVGRRVLGHPLLVGIGLISYPLYLWHWPLLSFSRMLQPGEASAGWSGAAVVLSVVLAGATYRFIEKPIRFGRRSAWRVGALFAGLASLALLGAASETDRIVARSEALGIGELLAAAGEWEYPGGLLPREVRGVRVYALGGEPRALFFGDSNMEQYAPRVVERLRTAQTRRGALFLIGAAASRCSVQASGGIRIVTGCSPMC